MKDVKSVAFRKSIFMKFGAIFIAVGLVPLFILSYVFYNLFASNVEKYILSNFQQMFLYTGKSIEKTINNYDNVTKLMYSYTTENEGTMTDILKIDESDRYSKIRKDVLINNFIKYILYTDQDIENVFFTRNAADQINYYTRGSKQFSNNAFFSEKSKDKNELKSLTIYPTHKEYYFVNSKDKVLTFSRNYMDTTTATTLNNVIGTLFIDIKVDVIKRLFNDVYLGEKGEVYLLDSKGNCVYNNLSNEIELSENWFSEYKGAKGIIDKGEYYYISETIPSIDWQVLGKVYKEDINSNLQVINRYIAIIAVISSAFLVLSFIMFYRWFSVPLKNMLSGMKKIQSGDFSAKVSVKNKDEIGRLAEGFNNMSQDLKNYIDKAYVAEIKQREAELNALKTQIKPHYLYNTLEVIRMSAVANDDEEVSDMIDGLSSQLRYILGYASDIVTLEQEINNIESYFKLIRVRYENRMELQVDIPLDLMHYGILKLSLQPIVENAVMHGLKLKDNKGKINIVGAVNEGFLELTVLDDGVGISEDKLREINNILASDKIGLKTDKGWKDIGMKNVNDRIKKYFGKEYGIDIKSYPGLGTSVKFQLPLIEEVNASDEGFDSR